MEKINQILNSDGVISFVTDTVWGIGCLPSSEKAVEKIYEIKGRDRTKPLILMSNKIEYLLPYVENMSKTAKNLAEKYLPGALTIIVNKSAKTPLYMTSQKDTVGIRIPNNCVFSKLCENIDGHVLATTSANLSGQPSAKTLQEAKSFIGDHVDYIVENEEDNAKGLESTVILALDENIKILRQGSIFISNSD